MKRILLVVPAILYFNSIICQINSSYQWTWLGGDSSYSQFGHYGQKGKESPQNMPGSRSRMASWKDKDGNFWMFGGAGYGGGNTGALNDLWRYNVSNNTWTWMAGSTNGDSYTISGTLGVFDVNNTPSGRRDAAAWIGNSGTSLYLFGGYTNVNSYNNSELWEYSIPENKWRILKYTVTDQNGNCNGQATYDSLRDFHAGIRPPCRFGSTATSYGSVAYVFGGSFHSVRFPPWFVSSRTIRCGE